MVKIAYIVPTTSKGFTGKYLNETLFLKITIPSFLQTYDKEHQYKFFIGIDKHDPLYDTTTAKDYISNKLKTNNIEIEFILYENIKKGHLTRMWNILFKHAYDQNFEYFFQGGDDLEFITKGWVNDFIDVLKKNNDIGLTGADNCIMRNKNYDTSLLTQTFVSRRHMELFGHYFPDEIINWFCDDWLTATYKIINKYFMLPHHKCINRGGKERYDIIPNINYLSIVKKDVEKISYKYNFDVNDIIIKKICDYDSTRFKRQIKF
jgi:hypothetical protein